MNKILFTFFISITAPAGFAADCGIKPKGMDFGPNCELIRIPTPPKKSAPLSSPLEPAPQRPAPQAKKKSWTPVLLGAYSGKPGYYVMIGEKLDLKLDALLMNEDTMEKAQEATKDLKLGGLIPCDAVGLQQSIGYTIFDLKNCEPKK